MEILVFKTNIPDRTEAIKVQPVLNSFSAIEQWNFDFDDDDHILRVVTAGLSPRWIENALHQMGYQCNELED